MYTAASVVGALLAIILVGILPLLRADRATPGAWATWLGLAAAGAGRPASRGRTFAAFAVRWLPAIVTGLPFVLPLTLLLEAITVAVRRDRRSLSSVLAGTETVTARSFAGLRVTDPEA
jgi:drug/metabolite transporter (DMT)-like permease